MLFRSRDHQGFTAAYESAREPFADMWRRNAINGNANRYEGKGMARTPIALANLKLKLESERLSQDESARLKRLDFLRFQIEELRAAELLPGEEEGLQHEKSLLQSAQGRLQATARLRELLEENEDANLIQLLQLGLRRIDELSLLDRKSTRLNSSHT